MMMKTLSCIALLYLCGCASPPNYVEHIHSQHGEFWYYRQYRPTNPSGMCAVIEGLGVTVHYAVDVAADHTQTVMPSEAAAKEFAEKACPTK